MQKVHEEHYCEIKLTSQWCNVFLINKILIILDESANFLQRTADKSGSKSANVGAPVIIIKYCFHVQTEKRSRKEGAGFLYSRCLSLDQNSPAPRTRAASHQEKTPTQRLIMRQKIQCGGDRVPLASIH